MSKRKTAARDRVSDHLDPAPDNDLPDEDQRDPRDPVAGVPSYDPNGPIDLSDPNSRPGQGLHRNDDVDAAYRAAQSMTGPGQAITRSESGPTLQDPPAGPGHEHKPAEPTEASPPDEIRGVPYPAAKPAVETVESGRIPGAGDPQNGVMTPPGASPISWARPDAATAQHYETAEDPREVAKLREDPYANQPKDPATAPQDPYPHQQQPQQPQQDQPKDPREDD